VQQGISNFNTINCELELSNALTLGGTYQLRFAVAETLATYNMGVDNVRLMVVPEPASIWLLSFSLAIVIVLTRYWARA